MSGPHTIRRATPPDLPVVLGLLAESARWMHERGFNAWPPDGFPAGRIRPGVAEGTVWLMEDGTTRQPVGTLALDTHGDPEFTAAGLDPGYEHALIVHRMATCRRADRRGLGSLLLDWAVDRTARHGLSQVWLNVARNALPLQAWYSKHGFTHMTTVTATGRKSGSLWRRPAEQAVGLIELP